MRAGIFMLATMFLVGMFIVLPSTFGAFAAVNLARFLDRRSFQDQPAGIARGSRWSRFGGGCSPKPLTDDMLETRVIEVLDRMLSKTRFRAVSRCCPATGFQPACSITPRAHLRTSAFFALVLLSNTLFFGFLALTAMGTMFYEASSAVHSRGSILAGWKWARQRPISKHRTTLSPGWLERLLGVMWFVRADRRALILKDIRLFWRDTTQWGQTLVLFGLLAAYIINLRHFSRQLTNTFWVDLVSYLNLGACSLNLATLTTRFVYPQFSLEGKRVWIIGMAPLGLMRVVLTKYVLSTCASLVITIGLVWGSCYMLRMPWERTIFFSYAVAVMTLTLNGLAIGLGVLYPNFKEDNPSKIVSGFGGTFCLVLSFLYILASVVALAFGAPWARAGTQPLSILITSWTAFAVLSMLIGWVPLKLALRKVRQLEL